MGASGRVPEGDFEKAEQLKIGDPEPSASVQHSQAESRTSTLAPTPTYNPGPTILATPLPDVLEAQEEGGDNPDSHPAQPDSATESVVEVGDPDLQPHTASSLPPPASTSPLHHRPSPEPVNGAIVAAVAVHTDLTWLSLITNPMWQLHRFNYDDPFPSALTSFPVNKGNEAMMFLSYIINNYERLPNYSIFIHGHRWSWHQQGDLIDIVNNIRFKKVDEVGYVSLRCDWSPSCPAELRPLDKDAVVWGDGVLRDEVENEIAWVWRALFPANEPLPRTIASQCCAQFILTRSAILSRDKDQYIRMREWLVNTPLPDDISGRVFEKLWAYIFTKEPVRCPPPQVCACEFFGQCGVREWPLPPVGLKKWADEFDPWNYVPEAQREAQAQNKTVVVMVADRVVEEQGQQDQTFSDVRKRRR